jgi:GNAT superfamily N-acetyltransferase
MGWAMLREGNGIGQERFREKIVAGAKRFYREVAKVAKRRKGRIEGDGVLEEGGGMKSAGMEWIEGGDEGADGRVLLRNVAGDEVAGVSVWWREVPQPAGKWLGAIGGFSAGNFADAKAVLEAAEGILRENGCDLAVGPMNGNTWRSYRFVAETNGRPAFLLEPRNPAEYAGWWAEAGFGELSRYSSSLMTLDGTEAVSAALGKRLERSGIVVRGLDAARYENELRLIHALSLKSFVNNFLYTPLEEEAFLASYLKVRAHVDPELVRIAERDGVPCGFVFGIPDLEAAMQGEKPALIVKTLAVDPASRSAGLGSLLVDELHRIARGKGYVEAIHALQHENNTSLKITGRHEGAVFRRYVLFSKLL